MVIVREKEAYRLWRSIHRNFPKTERFGIGQNIEQTFLRILEYSFIAAYLPKEQKAPMLGQIISRLDILKFFTQIAWESDIIPEKQYIILSEKLNEIGRMLYGWKNGLTSKTPAKK